MSSLALQKAVYGALTAALAPVKVYDIVPQDTPRPYVVIDSQLSADADALNKSRERINLYLSIWSDYRGQKEVLGLMAQIKAALHGTRPALEAGACAALRVRRESTARDIMDETFTGYVTLEAIVEP